MDILEKIKEISRKTNNEYIEKAKNNGKKVIGYFCSYIPEEIITAADMIPYRMRGVDSDGTDLADSYFSKKNCTFPRSIFNKMLKGDYEFLDGLVFMNSCDHTRRLFDNWKHARSDYNKFITFLDVPRKSGDISLDRYIQILKDFIVELSQYFNVKISDESLKKAILLHNEKRILLNEINILRRSKILPIKGSEYLALMLCITAIPVEDSIYLLKGLINEVKGRNVSNEDEVRLIVAGGCLEDVNHLEILENLGAAIVAENTCLGARYSDMLIDMELENHLAIAKRYLEHMSCARMVDGFKKRLDFVNNAIIDYTADGVIFEKLTFCILYGGDMYMFRKEANKQKYPLLVLEREYLDKAEGQIKTRVQAFIESLKKY